MLTASLLPWKILTWLETHITDILRLSGKTGAVAKMAGDDGHGDGNGTATPSWWSSIATMTKAQQLQQQKM